jgi:hypothetical protein
MLQIDRFSYLLCQIAKYKQCYFKAAFVNPSKDNWLLTQNINYGFTFLALCQEQDLVKKNKS